LHVEDPGRHDRVQDFDGEAHGTRKLVRDPRLDRARVRVAERHARVLDRELLDHEIRHDDAVRETGVEREIVFQVQIVHPDVTLGARGEDGDDAREFVLPCGFLDVGDEVEGEAHAGVVVDAHFLVEAFDRFAAALEGHVAGCEEEAVDFGFVAFEVVADFVDVFEDADVFFDEDGFAVGVDGFEFFA